MVISCSHSLNPQCHWSTYNFLCRQKNCNYSMVPANRFELLFIQRAKGQALQSQQSIFTSNNRYSTYSMTNGIPMTNSQTRIVQQPSAHSYTDGRMGTMKTTKLQLQQSAWAHSLLYLVFKSLSVEHTVYILGTVHLIDFTLWMCIVKYGAQEGTWRGKKILLLGDLAKTFIEYFSALPCFSIPPWN